MSEGLMIYFDKDGKAKEYNDTYDIIIHCESKKEHEEVINKLRRFWQCDKDVLDEIRFDIVHLHDLVFSRTEVLKIIDKYKAESEGKHDSI